MAPGTPGIMVLYFSTTLLVKRKTTVDAILYTQTFFSSTPRMCLFVDFLSLTLALI
jgi:hypothetical protein